MTLRTKNMHYFKFLLFLALPTCVAAQNIGNKEVAEEKLTSSCKKLMRADANFYVIKPNGIIAGKNLDLGDVFENRITSAIDLVRIDTQHRLVVNRKNVDEFIAPDLSLVKVKSTCQGTSEYNIFYTVKAKAAEIGKQTSKLVLAIGRSGRDDRIEGEISFSANVISPKIELNETANTPIEATSFFQNTKNTFTLEIKNTGTGPLIIDALKQNSSNSKWYSVDSKNCHAKSVQPQGRCNIIFTRSSAMHSDESTDTFEIISNYKLGHPNFAITWSDVKTEIEFSAD